jgi:DNA-directed RNA polymerase specialized sigma24 family protein
MHSNEGKSELGQERERDYSDNWAAVRKLEGKIFCEEVISQLPMHVVFGLLSDDEKLLATLMYLEEMSPSEIAGFLGRDKNPIEKRRVSRACNRLRNKIRKRIQRLIKGTPFEDLLVKRTRLSQQDIAKEPRAA